MNDNAIEYVTATIGGQLFGLPIERVQDVFMPERLTRVPLAAGEIAGLLNLRGRIVTVIDMGRRLDYDGRSIAPPSEANGQRGQSGVRAHSASEDARERADATRPEAGSSAPGDPAVARRAALASEASGQRGNFISARAGHSPEAGSSTRAALAVGIEHRGESYGLLIDQIGEVLKLPAASREDNPVNLDSRLARVSAGVHRLDGRLMVVLDVDRVLEIAPAAQAA